MWVYEKRLQYPVKITKTCPKTAQLIISQYGGPDGELSASMRYLSQRFTMPCKKVGGLLTDIGTEELAHLEIICSMVYQLTKNLTVEEAAALMDLPADDTKGLRDKALLEFMYGTGARVTEVVRLRFSDVNLRMNFVTLRDVNDESRIVPLGSYASTAMKQYFEKSHDVITGREHEDDDFVFVNFRGEPLTRQGIWKILKDYGQMMGVESRMTPQILRDSFAVHILQNGGDLRTLQELMGFEDMSVGIAYLSVIDIRVREVFRSCHPRA